MPADLSQTLTATDFIRNPCVQGASFLALDLCRVHLSTKRCSTSTVSLMSLFTLQLWQSRTQQSLDLKVMLTFLPLFCSSKIWELYFYILSTPRWNFTVPLPTLGLDSLIQSSCHLVPACMQQHTGYIWEQQFERLIIFKFTAFHLQGCSTVQITHRMRKPVNKLSLWPWYAKLAKCACFVFHRWRTHASFSNSTDCFPDISGWNKKTSSPAIYVLIAKVAVRFIASASKLFSKFFSHNRGRDHLRES